jgi:hypothetical protein
MRHALLSSPPWPAVEPAIHGQAGRERKRARALHFSLGDRPLSRVSHHRR